MKRQACKDFQRQERNSPATSTRTYEKLSNFYESIYLTNQHGNRGDIFRFLEKTSVMIQNWLFVEDFIVNNLIYIFGSVRISNETLAHPGSTN